MHKALEITISPDQLTCSMVVKKEVLEKQKELTYPGLLDVMAALEELKVVYGIDKDKIVDNLKYKDTPVVIAKGRQHTPTVNDTVAYTFEDLRNKAFTPTILADGKANFYDLVQFKICKENELLVFVKKGRSGENGMTVTGVEIMPDKYVEMSSDILKKFVGPNAEVTNQGIVAKVTGIPMIDALGKVSVHETYIIQGDVDFSTGSIDYEGPVIIKGAVTNNFTVKTPKDVIVEGIVDGGIIEAGGMVSLLGGINKGKVRCKKNLIAKYIYTSDIICESTVITDEAILNSNIIAKTIIAKGEPTVQKSGQISGGKMEACNFVWAKTLGSGSANYTEVIIRSFIDIEPYEALAAEKNKLTHDVEKIYKTMQLMEEMKKKTPNLPPEFKANLIKLFKTRVALEKKLKEVKAQTDTYEKLIEKENKECARKIYVTVAYHPKVLIRIFEKKVLSKQEYGPSIVHIKPEDEQIIIEPATSKMELPVGYEPEG
ncbi:MAG: FapA family protein [Cyanobacteriota bacterium]